MLLFDDYSTDHLFEEYKPIAFPCFCGDYDHIIWGIWNPNSEVNDRDAVYLLGRIWMGDPEAGFFQRLFSRKGMYKFTFDCMPSQETFETFKPIMDVFKFDAEECKESFNGEEQFIGWVIDGELPTDYKFTFLEKLTWIFSGSVLKVLSVGYYFYKDEDEAFTYEVF